MDYQVIFRQRESGKDWNIYCTGTSPEDAAVNATIVLTRDYLRCPDEIVNTSLWDVAEIMVLD